MNTTGIDGFGDLVKVVNDGTGGILMNGGIIVFFIIVLVLLLKDERPFEEALTVAGWSFVIVSAIFWAGSFISLVLPLFFLVIAALGSLYMFATRP